MTARTTPSQSGTAEPWSISAPALLVRYLSSLRWRVVLLGVLLLAGLAAQLIGPQLARDFIDGAVGDASARSLYRLAALFVAASIAAQLLAVAAAYLSEQIGWTATNLLRTDLLRHCLHLDMPFHHAHSPGQLIERIDGDVTALSNFFSQFVLRLLGGLLIVIGVVTLMLLEEPRIGGTLAVFVVLSLVVLVKARDMAVPYVNAERDASAELYGFIEERLGGVDDIRANGAGEHVMRGSFAATRRFIRTARRAEVMSSGVWVIASTLLTASYIVILAASVWLFIAGEVTVGTVYLFFQYMQIMRRPLEQVAEQLKDFQRAAAAVGRVAELFGQRRDLADGERPLTTSGAAAVEFDGVSFAYHPAEPVLHNISVRLEPGSVLGVLGRTGCGKTTLTRLLLRFYDPTDGSVRLDGVDLRDLNREALRHRVAIVTQEVQLYAASLRDNLTLFDPDVSDEQIAGALDALALREWVEAMPAGLDTRLGAGGGGLSAGEAQLVAFARVFLRDPGLVILDEASSRLDPATEQMIERAVDRLLEGRTGVLVAHRLHTLDRCDEILVMHEGRIVEHGPREALAKTHGSRYAELLAASAGEVTA